MASLLLQLNEAVVGHQPAEEMALVIADFMEIEMLEAAVARTVEHDQNCHHLGRAEGRSAVIAPFAETGMVLKGVSAQKRVKMD